MTSRPLTYGRIAQWFHWIGAILIIGMWVVGSLMVRMGDTPLKEQLYRVHVGIGLVVLIVTVLRIVWQFIATSPEELPGLAGLHLRAFKWNHFLLYAIVILIAGSGIGMLLLSGLSISPADVTPAAIQEVPPRAIHGIGSKLLAALFVMHVVGVLYYQFTEGDTLSRIGISWFQREGESHEVL